MPLEAISSASAHSKPISVFVVDDEHVIASTLAMILTNSGFNAVSFSNPLAALESARILVPELLITDVMMPEISGIELAIRFRALHPKCKILLFSGHAATGDLLDVAKLAGHQDFHILTKPVHPTELLAAIRKL